MSLPDLKLIPPDNGTHLLTEDNAAPVFAGRRFSDYFARNPMRPNFKVSKINLLRVGDPFPNSNGMMYNNVIYHRQFDDVVKIGKKNIYAAHHIGHILPPMTVTDPITHPKYPQWLNIWAAAGYTSVAVGMATAFFKPNLGFASGMFGLVSIILVATIAKRIDRG